MDYQARRKLLIVNREQYGYHVDPYKYTVYLKKQFEITHLSWDYGLPKISQEGIEIKYISRSGNKLSRYLRFLGAVHKEIRNHSYDLIFLVYFMGCSIIRLLNASGVFNVDIRTATDSTNPLKNRFQDLVLLAECKTFKNVSIINENLSENMGFKRTHLLPLGGECFSTENKQKDGLYMLYVGTLENRNMITFVKGFHQFYLELLKKPTPKPIHFTIVGDGPGSELEEIKEYVRKNQLQEVISTEGYVHNDQLHHYFRKSNIGVSFIPITDYYQDQPPTKTYEYLLSGLAVIATATNENVKIVNDKNGVLIQDTVEAVKSGLQLLDQRLERYHPEEIRQQMRDHHWEKIVAENLRPYLISLIRAGKSFVTSVAKT
ncbi:Glycosyl transferases group 1 [Cyclobacterium lianum]|uniref:Glycosyl transferases group 1 n=1 Tax=Cyclobacterium lianum TaxID=388280 RepID=A0A1M7IMA1_9BACT|nr:glycosyltransferase [Cyclobacterium lianum]SHM41946.1 Glycosyl transferases group 1 [Cyclobacterium lianum]